MNSNDLIDRLVETFVHHIEKTAAAGNHTYVFTTEMFTETLNMINETIRLEQQLYQMTVHSSMALATIGNTSQPSVTHGELISALQLKFPDCVFTYETQLINGINHVSSVCIDWS